MNAATEKPLISICIPTYQRADLLVCAIESCLKQTYQNIEVVISDDSPDNCSEKAILKWIESNEVRYCRNSPALKQAGNVNRLFNLARGKYLILLHDDDLLLPDAVQDMYQCFQEYPDIDACFGKQQVIDMKGTILDQETQELNQDYYRGDNYAGSQISAMKSALVSQFPNDAYLVRAELAKSIGYRDSPEVSHACDYDFGLRLAASANRFYFLNQFTAAYRVTEISILRDNNYTNITYELISSIPLPIELEGCRDERLQKYASPAINRWLHMNQKKAALRIYFSKHYSWRRRISAVGIVQIFLFLMPSQITLLILSKRYAFR
jgi:glycosyltransferase involved in cell wall biosynthesis